MLIGLDMDGVKTGFDEHLDVLLEEVPELHDFPRSPERGWNNFWDADVRHRAHVLAILEHPDFFRKMPAIPGAIDAANRMRELGHDVIFISSPWQSNPQGFQAKADWLNEHLGSWARKNLILTADKTLVHADVLVDDKPVIKGRMTPSWERIFFTQPYNSMLPGLRIDNWTDGTWEDVLHGVEDRLQGVR